MKELNNMFERHFDAEGIRVYVAAALGITLPQINLAIGSAVGVVSFFYISCKLIKQLRDWKKPDKD